jgi:hypothetical protein
VRQCQSLATREKQGGEPLTSQEREKLDKMPGWWVRRAAPGSVLSADAAAPWGRRCRGARG